LGEIYTFRSFLAMQRGERERASSWARQALALLPATGHAWRGMSLMSLGVEALQTGQLGEARHILAEIKTLWHNSVEPYVIDGITLLSGMVCFEQGDLHQASLHFQKLYDSSSLPQDNPFSLGGLLGLARICYERNDLDQVERMLQILSSQEAQITVIPVDIYRAVLGVNWANLQQARGETDLAMQSLTSFLPHLRILPNELALYFYQDILDWLVRLSLRMEDHSTAQYWLDDASFFQSTGAFPSPDVSLLSSSDSSAAIEPHSSQNVSLATHTPFNQFIFVEQKRLLFARLQLARKEEDAALITLAELLPAAQAAGRGRRAFQMKLLMAQAYAARKQMVEARRILLEALKQGYAEGYQRLFLDEGNDLFYLLRDVLPHVQGQALRNYIKTLIQAFAQPPHTSLGGSAVETFEPLSMQEQRVLRLLAAGNSNREIARQLVVSVNTVRSQVQSIYRKLQVNNRYAAREAAHSLHLL
ncbi:MAG TPA: LuxR C-terminal-related transcriptional regulator, partial [Ktedonobacteraceae bacterium]|nr:LuxR C-terminal-related transcriptional regulator [Ktedonobacteraceae bacterium]